jgi:hypothetical protein
MPVRCSRVCETLVSLLLATSCLQWWQALCFLRFRSAPSLAPAFFHSMILVVLTILRTCLSQKALLDLEVEYATKVRAIRLPAKHVKWMLFRPCYFTFNALRSKAL